MMKLLPNLKSQALLIALALISLGIGIWVGSPPERNEESQLDQARKQEVISQSRLLADTLQSELDSVRALALSLLAYPNWISETPLIHWTEVEATGPQTLAIRRTAWNTKETQLERSEQVHQYLNEAMDRLKTQFPDQQKNRMTVFSLQGGLAVAFAVPGSPRKAILALLDVDRAFPVFQRWSARSEGGLLRGYLMDENGRVLAHSKKSYVGSDFSRLPLYKEALSRVFHGDRITGTGTYVSVDQLKALSSYLKLDGTPFAVIVERVQTQQPMAAPGGRMGKGVLSLVLVAMMVFGASLLQRRTTEQSTVDAFAIDSFQSDEVAMGLFDPGDALEESTDVFQVPQNSPRNPRQTEYYE